MAPRRDELGKPEAMCLEWREGGCMVVAEDGKGRQEPGLLGLLRPGPSGFLRPGPGSRLPFEEQWEAWQGISARVDKIQGVGSGIQTS